MNLRWENQFIRASGSGSGVDQKKKGGLVDPDPYPDSLTRGPGCARPSACGGPPRMQGMRGLGYQRALADRRSESGVDQKKRETRWVGSV